MRNKIIAVIIIVVALSLFLVAYCTYQPLKNETPVEEPAIEEPQETTVDRKPPEPAPFEQPVYLPESGGPDFFLELS
jgi:hypothetical protein